MGRNAPWDQLVIVTKLFRRKKLLYLKQNRGIDPWSTSR